MKIQLAQLVTEDKAQVHLLQSQGGFAVYKSTVMPNIQMTAW